MRIIKCKVTTIADGDYQKVVNAIGRPNEEIVNRSYFQHVGFTSRPPTDTVGIIIDDGNNLTMIASADPLASRPELANEKDVAIYTDADNYIKINGDTDDIKINSEGKIEIGITAFAKVLVEAAATLYNNHGHVYVPPSTGVPLITSQPTASVIAATVPAPMGATHMSTVVEVT